MQKAPEATVAEGTSCLRALAQEALQDNAAKPHTARVSRINCQAMKFQSISPDGFRESVKQQERMPGRVPDIVHMIIPTRLNTASQATANQGTREQANYHPHIRSVMDLDFVTSGEESFGKPHKKKKKKKKGKENDNEADFGSGWTDVDNPNNPGFDAGLDTFASSSVQPEADGRTSRRVSFSDDPPESRTFNKPDADNGAGVGLWLEDLTPSLTTSPAKPDQLPQNQKEELCRRCGKTFDLWDSVFCRHCGCKRGSPPDPGTPSTSVEPGLPLTNLWSEDARPLERRFSFSLTDMADGQLGQMGSPYLRGSEPIRESLELQKWNPLNGVRRHWNPCGEEIRQGQPELMQAGVDHGLGMTLQCGNVAEDVQKAEQRLKGLQQKISHLSSSLSGDAWPAGGRIPMLVTELAPEGGLGVALQDLAVARITHPHIAARTGWAVGDHILQVNGIAVLNDLQLSQELAKAFSAHKAVGRSIHLEVWRPAAKTQSALLGRPNGFSAGVATSGGQALQSRGGSPDGLALSTEPVAGPMWAGPQIVPYPPGAAAVYPTYSPGPTGANLAKPSRRRTSLC